MAHINIQNVITAEIDAREAVEVEKALQIILTERPVITLRFEGEDEAISILLGRGTPPFTVSYEDGELRSFDRDEGFDERINEIAQDALDNGILSLTMEGASGPPSEES